jgi:uncharacterized protein (TIGR00288 family)
MKPDRVALLIDADNVSIDVIEQAVAWVAKHYGGPHLRRAYCTPESAVKNQDAFKRLSVRPMVNLAAGKNSTDIALAVDAIEIAINEQPDVLVIASSDSDFAPVVARLRERGCRVVGLGQQGKVGQETKGVYDDYEVFEHRGGDDTAPAPRARARVPRAAGSKTARAAGKKTAVKAAPTATAKKPAAGKAAATKAPRKTAAAKKAVRESAQAPPIPPDDEHRFDEHRFDEPMPRATEEADMWVPPAAPAPAARTSSRRASKKATRDVHDAGSATLDAVLRALPELSRGATLAFNDVGQRLRAAGLLSKSGSSMKLLRQFSGDVILEPADRPSRVRLAGRG